MQAASQLPLQLPAQWPVLGMPVPPEAVQVPLQLLLTCRPMPQCPALHGPPQMKDVAPTEATYPG